MADRQINYAQAILEATGQCLKNDSSVYVMGLGATDPKGVFGTTIGLKEKYPNRVFDMPLSENGMTGVAVGAALVGMRPILTHQRIDFTLMSMDQIVNNVAKWNYMFGGDNNVPIVIRMIVGRGWGQGPQHSQNLQALFMHIPGLKVVMPFTPYDAKGLLIASVEDNSPVIFIENRWLHNVRGSVPEDMYSVPLGRAHSLRKGKDVLLITSSYMVIECLKAADVLQTLGIEAEVVDLRTVKPLDSDYIIALADEIGRVVVVDSGYMTCGLAAEVSALLCENCFSSLKSPIKRVTLPDGIEPTTRALVKDFYPDHRTIIRNVLESLQIKISTEKEELLFADSDLPCDVPDSSFMGPF